MNTMEKFDNLNNSKIPSATIRKNGSLSLNAIAMKAFPINKDIRHVALYFDQGTRVIGIKAADDQTDPCAFTVSQEKNGTPNIACRSFLKHFGIQFEARSKAYPATWDPETGMILVKVG